MLPAKRILAMVLPIAAGLIVTGLMLILLGASSARAVAAR
jgi:hypothetical protein